LSFGCFLGVIVAYLSSQQGGCAKDSGVECGWIENENGEVLVWILFFKENFTYNFLFFFFLFFLKKNKIKFKV
jgi:hypothetical protein